MTVDVKEPVIYSGFFITVSCVRSFCYNKETERKRYESRSFGGGDTMNYGELKKTDIANGIGVRVTLFVSGCTHHCPGCFQPETWDFAYGQKYTWETEMEIIEALKPGYVKGLTLLGGEPFEPANQRELVYLLRRINNEMPKKTIWCYTGYTLETDLLKESRARCAVTDEMLSRIDVLVDGEFVQAKKDITLRFRGSSNQRIIDLKATLAEGRTVLYKFPDE